MSGDHERYIDGDRLLLIDCEEVYVEACVEYRMELKLVKDCAVGLAIVEDEVNDECLRGIGDTLEFFLIDCEEDVLHSETIKIAWNESLLAESLDDGFVANLTDLAFQFKMLHFVLF